MGSGCPDGWQGAFLICQSTISSWQAQEQLSVSKYSLGQSHLKVSVLVPPVGRVCCSSAWGLNPQVQMQPWSCRAFLEKISQASKTMSLLHLVRIKADSQQGLRSDLCFLVEFCCPQALLWGGFSCQTLSGSVVWLRFLLQILLSCWLLDQPCTGSVLKVALPILMFNLNEY